MKLIFIVLCAALFLGTMHAQTTSRFGGYFGNYIQTVNYTFMGVEQQPESTNSGVLGILIEEPISSVCSIQISPQLTRYSSGMYFFNNTSHGSETEYHTAFFNERWIVEIPVALKVLLSGGAFRPYVAGGFVLGIATPPEDLWLEHHGSNSTYSYEEFEFPSFHGGVTASSGIEISPKPSFMFFFEAGVTQLLRRAIDVPSLMQKNTPRFSMRFGVLFVLNAEEWL